MAIINTVEARILEMGGGEFQKLCDAFLSRIGYGKPNSFGIQNASNKVRKGTPDTFFEKKDGKLAFAEYTTQRTNTYKKLDSDIDKCIHKITNSENRNVINEIIICYTSQISSNELLKLRTKCTENGLVFTNFGLSALANELIQIPSLMKEFLNFSLDTGQIIPLESFPLAYQKSKFSTTLVTKFQFREKELQDIENSLNNNDLVILLGKPGIGKTRLAIEACRRFILTNSDYQAFSIINFSQNLFDDIREQFSLPGKYLIFVDDANRVISFDYFMSLLRNKKENQQIKIVTTVRDYAFDKIVNDIGLFPLNSFEIEQLKDEQIKEIVRQEFGIENHNYLDRIIEIASGNPRLAMMASAIARGSNNLASINDASALYDEYFKSIKSDLENIGDINILKTAGIISFLRNVDRTNEEMMLKISQSFDISSTDFWNCAYRLNQLEFVDMYENQIVKFSDQVLSTYFFYFSLFKEKVLDFSDILNNYFPVYQAKIDDALFPVISVFGQQKIISQIELTIKSLWFNFEESKNEESLLKLAKSYWFLLPTETLQFISTRLRKSINQPLDDQIFLTMDSNKLNNWQLSTELQILGNFANAKIEYIEIVINLLLNYINTNPSDLFGVLRIINESYGFRKRVFDEEFAIQNKVIDCIWERVDLNNGYIYTRLFLAVCSEFMKTHFDFTQYRTNNSITIFNYNLLPNKNIFILRNKILTYLFDLYEKYPTLIIEVFEKYISGIHESSSTKIIKNDSKIILNFVSNKLPLEDLKIIIFAHRYFDFLKNNKITFDKEISTKFTNFEFEIYTLLLGDKNKPRRVDFEKNKIIRKNEVIRFFHNLTEEQYYIFIQTCNSIQKKLANTQIYYQLVNGFSYILQKLGEYRPETFRLILENYLSTGDFFSINPVLLLKLYSDNFGIESAHKLITGLPKNLKTKWQIGYYQIKAIDTIIKDDLDSLYELFEHADYFEIPQNLDFVLNFEKFDKNVVAKIIKILLNKPEPKNFIYSLIMVFNPYTEINKRLVTLFKENIELLKSAYFFVISNHDHDDFDATTLCKILELDDKFLLEYITFLSETDVNSNWRFETQDFSKIWSLLNHKKILIDASERLFQLNDRYVGLQLADLLNCGVHKKVSAEIVDKRNSLIDDLIFQNKSNGPFLEFLFEAVSNLPDEQRLHFISTFLEVNPSLEIFRNLALESRSHSWSGSAVPMYQSRIDFFTLLLPKLTKITLLDHKLYIDKKILDLEKQKRFEKIRDFCES